jgi:hypothetical protein
MCWRPLFSTWILLDRSTFAGATVWKAYTIRIERNWDRNGPQVPLAGNPAVLFCFFTAVPESNETHLLFLGFPKGMHPSLDVSLRSGPP